MCLDDGNRCGEVSVQDEGEVFVWVFRVTAEAPGRFLQCKVSGRPRQTSGRTYAVRLLMGLVRRASRQ